MKRKVRKLIAFVMSLILLGAVSSPLSFNAYAADEGKVAKPEVSAKTSESISLKTENDKEYAIENEKDGKKVWVWAEEKQYDREKGTVTFSELKAETEYKFAVKSKGQENTEEYIIKIIKTESIDTPPETTTTPPETTAAPPETTVTPPENKSPAADPKLLNVPSSLGNPVIISVEDSVIELGPPTDLDAAYTCQYSINNGADYQNGGKFTGLEPGTVYKVKIKVEITPDNILESTVMDVKTKLIAPPKPVNVPGINSRTDTVITLGPGVAGSSGAVFEYGQLVSGTVTEWKETGIFEGLTPGTEYTFVMRAKVNDAEQMPGDISDPLIVSTKQSAAPAPPPPELLSRTETTISLKPVDGQEYGRVQSDGSVIWQDSPEFTGLNANTAYSFKTRLKFDPDKSMDSLESQGVQLKTIIAFQGSSVTGIKEGASYDVGALLTAAVTGNGMDNLNPTAGDTRWIPKNWNWGDDVSKEWSTSPYTIPFTLTKAGTYKLSVGFQLEEYKDGRWIPTDTRKSLTTTFKAIEKKAVYFTINASSGANGKINPKGAASVAKGKDFTFTFIPDKGYYVSKVFVDGKQVNVKDNKYTFKSVEKNHTISVTFGKTRLGIPQTGDNINLTLLWGAVIVSGCLVIIFLAEGRKRRKTRK